MQKPKARMHQLSGNLTLLYTIKTFWLIKLFKNSTLLKMGLIMRVIQDCWNFVLLCVLFFCHCDLYVPVSVKPLENRTYFC
jgi:uncharacterized membrane protein YobD (UPF0266 family)